MDSVQRDLQKLQDLYDSGFIFDEEYQRRKRELLELAGLPDIPTDNTPSDSNNDSNNSNDYGASDPFHNVDPYPTPINDTYTLYEPVAEPVSDPTSDPMSDPVNDSVTNHNYEPNQQYDNVENPFPGSDSIMSGKLTAQGSIDVDHIKRVEPIKYTNLTGLRETYVMPSHIKGKVIVFVKTLGSVFESTPLESPTVHDIGELLGVHRHGYLELVQSQPNGESKTFDGNIIPPGLYRFREESPDKDRDGWISLGHSWDKHHYITQYNPWIHKNGVTSNHPGARFPGLFAEWEHHSFNPISCFTGTDVPRALDISNTSNKGFSGKVTFVDPYKHTKIHLCLRIRYLAISSGTSPEHYYKNLKDLERKCFVCRFETDNQQLLCSSHSDKLCNELYAIMQEKGETLQQRTITVDSTKIPILIPNYTRNYKIDRLTSCTRDAEYSTEKSKFRYFDQEKGLQYDSKIKPPSNGIKDLQQQLMSQLQN